MSDDQTTSAPTAAWLGVILCWLSLALLLAIGLTHYPDNHISLDIRICYILGVLTALVAVLGRAVKTLGLRLFLGALLSGILLVVAVFVLDHWNMVVGYEEWVSRGQPGFGQLTPD